jgi:hypothetical protein
MAKPAKKEETKQGPAGQAARKARNLENFKRATGRDPDHPVAGSAAWAEKNNFPPDTKDMPRS